MVDLHSGSAGRANAGFTGPSQPPTPTAAATDSALVAIVELLFFAYRDFTHEADAVLAGFGFGRAHHRVLHFVNRNPGLRVADLLDILRITKQSLARVLKELVDRGFVVQEAGAQDRRERRLHLTAKGQILATQLTQLQTTRIKQALTKAGPAAEDVAQAFLMGIVGLEHRAQVAQVLERGRLEVDSGTEEET